MLLALFLLESLLYYWIVFRDGAEWIENSWLGGLLTGMSWWHADMIRIYIACFWVIRAVLTLMALGR